jgi:hypothetical protein
MRYLNIKVDYKDGTKETFKCVDYPNYGQFITLYFQDFERRLICPDKVDGLTLKIQNESRGKR